MQSSLFLSILIPVYNWDVRALLRKVHAQSAALREKCRIEIIVMDDGSIEKYDIISVVKQLPLVSYEAFPVNRGRVAIRNLLLERARGEYILFLDADMLPDHDTFLQSYVKHAESGRDIICGGISYLQNVCKDGEYSFYFYKSLKTETVPAKVRSRTPWRYLFTSNIMLRRRIVESVRFEPRFTGYGFEDIEWAIRLADSYTITHIDNTCSHMGLMTKEQTFTRMRSSIENYALLLALHREETEGSIAKRISGFLKVFPESALRGTDALLTKLFYLPWNPLSFIIFQCDKMVLLAKVLKRKEKAGIP